MSANFEHRVLEVHVDLFAFPLTCSKGDPHDQTGHFLPGVLQASRNLQSLDELVDLVGMLNHGWPGFGWHTLDGLASQTLVLSKDSHAPHGRVDVCSLLAELDHPSQQANLLANSP